MKNNKALFLFVSILFLFTKSYAQSDDLLTQVPKTKEEFIATEKNVLATIDWLENTPVNQDKEKRKNQYAMLLAWITETPTVSIGLRAEMIEFSKKNSELLFTFMGGWTRYSLLNNYSKDQVECNLAGIRSAIKVYKSGLLKKDKELEKLIDLDEKGKLKSYIAELLAKG
jgi:hypothetical protein